MPCVVHLQQMLDSPGEIHVHGCMWQTMETREILLWHMPGMLNIPTYVQ